MGCKISGGDFSFLFERFFFCFFLYGPQVDSFFLFFLFSYRMARGHEEVSTSQARHRRGTPREMPTASSLVASMSVKELRLYS